MFDLTYTEAIPAENTTEKVRSADTGLNGRVFRAAWCVRGFTAGGLTFSAIPWTRLAILVRIAISIAADRASPAVLWTLFTVLCIGIT